MTSVLQSDHSLPRCGPWYVLPGAWVSGLFLGILIYFHDPNSARSLMRGIQFSAMSIVGASAAALLPFLISAFAVLFSKSWIFYLISFFKAICYSYISLGILDAFGSAGWLIRFLLMFQEIFIIPILYAFWRRSSSPDGTPDFWACMGWFSSIFLVMSVHIGWIVPFYSGLNIL